MPDVRRLKQQLVPSNTDVGDGMSSESETEFIILI
jgi:hypothetical protein